MGYFHSGGGDRSADYLGHRWAVRAGDQIGKAEVISHPTTKPDQPQQKRGVELDADRASEPEWLLRQAQRLGK